LDQVQQYMKIYHLVRLFPKSKSYNLKGKLDLEYNRSGLQIMLMKIGPQIEKIQEDVSNSSKRTRTGSYDY
jgi:hypothetical protein